MGRAEEFQAEGRGQTFNYAPRHLRLVTDEASPLYDPRVHEKPARSFIDSIKRRGVMFPILVTQRIDDDGKPYLAVVCGRQRVMALLIAIEELLAEGQPLPGRPRSPQSKGLVPALLVNDLTDEEIREIIVEENEQRRADTLAGRISKANGMFDEYERTAEAEGLPFNAAEAHKRVAMAFGVPISTARRWREVPKLSAPARKAIFAGEVPIGQVDDLKAMSPANQAKAVEQAKAAGASSTKAARKATSDVPKAEPTKQTRRSRAAIEEKLAALGPRGAIIGGDPAERRGMIKALRWVLGEADTL